MSEVILKTIHTLGSAIWVGGLIIVNFVIIPVVKQNNDSNLKKIISKMYQRLFKLIIFTIPFIVISGILLAKNSSRFNGLFSFSNRYSTILNIKIILVLIMFLLIFFRKITQKKYMKTNNIAYCKKSELFIFLNMILGIVVIFLSYLLQ